VSLALVESDASDGVSPEGGALGASVGVAADAPLTTCAHAVLPLDLPRALADCDQAGRAVSVCGLPLDGTPIAGKSCSTRRAHRSEAHRIHSSRAVDQARGVWAEARRPQAR